VAQADPTGHSATDPPHGTGRLGKAGLAGLGTIGLLVWKFKFIAILLLTKAKFLLLGLTKASTFLSMLLSLGVYWSAFGWKFALGLVLSIYVHEMGHVYVLNRYGVKAGAPMFIPGFGALIRLRQEMTDPRQDALVGLAGPLWGLGAALFALAVGMATGEPFWLAIAKLGAWINLFNLLPLWQLDGGRAFHALSRSGRWFAVLTIAVAWSLTEESLLVLLMIGGVVRAVGPAAVARSDRTALAQYVFLIAVLSALTRLPVIVP
jgi:Zn-dependent protease